MLTEYFLHLFIADALQVGKIKNKVLKLTGEVQAINIKVCPFILHVGS